MSGSSFMIWVHLSHNWFNLSVSFVTKSLKYCVVKAIYGTINEWSAELNKKRLNERNNKLGLSIRKCYKEIKLFSNQHNRQLFKENVWLYDCFLSYQ